MRILKKGSNPVKYIFFIPAVLLFVIIFRKVIFLGEVFLSGDALFAFPPWNLFRNTAPKVEFDHVLIFYPWRYFLYDCLKQGIIPLWNPHNLCGVPFLGNAQNAAFSPFTLIALPFGLRNSFFISALLKLSFAFTGMWVFLKSRKLDSAPAVLGAIAFAFGGYQIHYLGKANTMVSAWLPWLFYTAERTRYNSNWRIGMGIICGLQALGGHIETTFYIVLFWSSYVLLRSGADRITPLPKRLRNLIIALAIGALLSAVQILPFLDYAANSNSLLERRTAQNAVPGAHPSYLALLALPDILGNPYFNSFQPGRLAYNELTAAYAGLLTLLLAVLAFVSRIRNLSFFRVWTLLAILLVYEIPGLSPLLRTIPILGLSYSLRAAVLLLFCIAVLAAFQWHKWLQMKKPLSQALPLILLVVGVLGIAYGLRGTAPEGGTPYSFLSNPRSLLPGPAAALLLPLFMIVNKHRKSLQVLLLLALCIDLAAFAEHANTSTPRNRLCPPTEGIQKLMEKKGNGRIAAIGHMMFPNLNLLFGLDDVRGYDSMVPVKYMKRLRQIDPGLVPRLYGNVCQFILFQYPDLAQLQQLGVRYLLLEPGERTTKQKALVNQSWIELYNRECIIIETSDPAPLVSTNLQKKVSWKRLSPQSLEIRTTTAPQSVTVRENFLPGWTAWCENRKLRIGTDELCFMKIHTPPGCEQIELCYQPLCYRLGLYLSCLGFTLILMSITIHAFTRLRGLHTW